MAANLEAEDARSLLMCIFKATFADLVLKRRLRWFCRRATDIKFKWDTSLRGVITHGEAKMTIQLTSIHSSHILVPSGNNGFHGRRPREDNFVPWTTVEKAQARKPAPNIQSRNPMLDVEVGESDLKGYVMIYVVGANRAGIGLLWARRCEDE